MVITCDSYQWDEHHRRLADELLHRAGVPAHDTFEIWVQEGRTVFHRYRVADARMINGKAVLTWKLRDDGTVETYASVWNGRQLLDTDSALSPVLGTTHPMR